MATGAPPRDTRSTDDESRSQPSTLRVRSSSHLDLGSDLSGVRVLVVDHDGASRHFIESALRKCAVTVVCVRDLEMAEEAIARATFDVVLCETLLPDGHGQKLLHRMAGERRFEDTSFVFWSADDKVETRCRLLRAGADDYLVKPCKRAELVARIEGYIRRSRRTRTAPASHAVLGGAMPYLREVIEWLCKRGEPATIGVVSARATGLLWTDGRAIIGAYLGSLSGDDAVVAALVETSGSFDVCFERASVPAGLRVSLPLNELVTMALQDPEKMPASVREKRKNRANTLRPGTVRIRSWLAPSARIAQQLEAGIKEPFALGDLHLLSEPELRAWTSDDGATDRFHVVMLASLAGGIASMLALASAPAERLIRAALGGGEKALTLHFSLRGGTVLDVVLIDIASPAPFTSALERTPSVLLVAPPGGEIERVGSRGRAELETVLANVTPTAVVAVGSERTREALRPVPVIRTQVSRFEWLEGDIDASPDLRALLVAAIQTWKSAAPGA
jgi:CheY-like chemotaxis protein